MQVRGAKPRLLHSTTLTQPGALATRIRDRVKRATPSLTRHWAALLAAVSGEYWIAIEAAAAYRLRRVIGQDLLEGRSEMTDAAAAQAIKEAFYAERPVSGAPRILGSASGFLQEPILQTVGRPLI